MNGIVSEHPRCNHFNLAETGHNTAVFGLFGQIAVAVIVLAIMQPVL